MEASTSVLTAAWTEVTNAVTTIMADNVAKLTLLLPLVGTVIGVARRLFVRKSR